MAELATMNLKQLRELARDLAIPNRSKMRKADLIAALVAAQSQASSEVTVSAPPRRPRHRIDAAQPAFIAH